jgi:NAD(P)-dependent dehydrogenase (short-subunit alcohol dehydrogenase family)
MNKLLDGKCALVTGCNGRLGPIWMDALQNAGARIYGTDLTPGENGWSHGDISDPSEVNRLVDYYPDVDILVNNAGVDSRPGDSGETEQAMLAVNLGGTSLMIEKFAASMMPRGGGVIINIASLYGLVAPDLRYYSHRPDGWVKDVMYGATKAGIIQMTRDYAARYARLGIRVNALAPGGVVAGPDGLTQGDPEFVKKYTNRIPLGRMATPADLGGPLVFLASEMSRFMTGQTLVLDGGYTAW